jgi:hypothetical protein
VAKADLSQNLESRKKSGDQIIYQYQKKEKYYLSKPVLFQEKKTTPENLLILFFVCYMPFSNNS